MSNYRQASNDQRRDEIIAAFKQAGSEGLTYQEIADLQGCNYYTARNYVQSLTEAGIITVAAHMKRSSNSGTRGSLAFYMPSQSKMPAWLSVSGKPIPLTKVLFEYAKPESVLPPVAAARKSYAVMMRVVGHAYFTKTKEKAYRPAQSELAKHRADLLECLGILQRWTRNVQRMLDDQNLWDTERLAEVIMTDPETPVAISQATVDMFASAEIRQTETRKNF